jgi:hypothetical protein
MSGKSAVGRTGALRLYKYPESRRGSAALTGPFARNFAAGPADNAVITIAGIDVPWGLIYSSGLAGTNIPITPIATGRIRVSGVLNVKNNSGSNESMTLVIRYGASEFAFPFLQGQTVIGANDGFEVVPFLSETLPGEAFPIGVTTNVHIFVTSTSDTALELIEANSTIEIQEVAVPTG